MNKKWWIDFECKKQTANSVNIYLKFWGPHPTRNQNKKYYTEKINTTFERAIENIFNSLQQNLFKNKWMFEPMEEYFYKNYFHNLLNKLLSLTESKNIKMPRFLYLLIHKDKLSELINEQQNINNIKLSNEKKFHKLNKKYNKIKLKIEQKTYLYKFEWFQKIKRKKARKLSNNIKNLENKIKIINEKLKKNYCNITQTKKKIEYWKINDVTYTDQIIGIENHGLIFKPIKTILLLINQFKNKKGVYVIHNKSNNKYYVGQSKDLYQRIGLQHFDLKTGQSKNPNFGNDYNKGDEFVMAIVELQTKDELDEAEKYYISFFDSFNVGYNKTGGNK